MTQPEGRDARPIGVAVFLLLGQALGMKFKEYSERLRSFRSPWRVYTRVIEGADVVYQSDLARVLRASSVSLRFRRLGRRSGPFLDLPEDAPGTQREEQRHGHAAEAR